MIGRKITPEQADEIRALARDGLTVRDIQKRIGISFSAVAKLLRHEGLKPDIGSAVTESFGRSHAFGQNETLVLTWAQNATPPHKPFLAALKAYCRHNKARLVVIPGRYKNPTSVWTESQQNEQWWHQDLVPYLYNQRTDLNRNLMLMADISIQPTAVFPLSAMETLSHGQSSIFGHPKIALRTIAAPHQRLPKIITTTGAVTKENYTNSKAGKKGEFNHVYGAVVVELAGEKIFHLRHVNARKDGAFCDLDKAYFPDGKVKKAGPYPAVVFGDVHVGASDPEVLAASFGKLINRLDPKELVMHDLFDAYSVNPHHEGNPFIKVGKRKSGRDDLSAEIASVIRFLSEYTKGRQTIIVPSNHDDMFARWMKRVDWRDDPTNAEYYLETALHMVRTLKMSRAGADVADPFRYWIDRAKLKNVRCLRSGESHRIKGIEVGLHGHEGPDGRRGSLLNLSRLGTKVISGHGHTPGIEAGHARVGTMTGKLEYTGPVSSWLNTHCAVDPFGKMHLLNCVNGSFWRDR